MSKILRKCEGHP